MKAKKDLLKEMLNKSPVMAKREPVTPIHLYTTPQVDKSTSPQVVKTTNRQDNKVTKPQV